MASNIDLQSDTMLGLGIGDNGASTSSTMELPNPPVNLTQKAHHGVQDRVHIASHNPTSITPAIPSQTQLPTSNTPLSTFDLFPNFPLDIRRQIWTSTFSPAHIDINIHQCHYTNKTVPLTPSEYSVAHSGPVALFVNRESREEALRLYTRIYPGWVLPSNNFGYPTWRAIRPPNNPQMRPVWLNPKLDSVWFSWDSLVDSEGMDKWLSYLDSSIKGGLGMIREVEVRDVSQEIGITREDGPLVQQLIKFKRLKSVRLTLFASVSGPRELALRSHSAVNCIHNMVIALRKKCYVFENGEPPVVHARLGEEVDGERIVRFMNATGELGFWDASWDR